MARAVSAVAGKVGDPAYAAALLAALGPGAFTRVLGILTGAPDAPSDTADAHGSTADAGNAAAGATAAGAGEAALLTKAFASAERTGRLGDEWRAMLESAPPQTLTALVTLTPQSGTVLNHVAVTLLNHPTPPPRLHALITAYTTNPLAFQQFLAEHPHETAKLLATADPALKPALDEALKPGVGADGLRERAWSNVQGLGG
uniref:Uncharacterized protein n=1 Tax=Nonomuraea gerenzanensis TaxID=93944 RepID=A0A1M4E4M9_9ACTN|nr:hypothetical protein [Nonomuraea gerenzanensis]SBO93791.1 hypothetical protein BN4615_P3305 [Nonomuraea gerenzanensis]